MVNSSNVSSSCSDEYFLICANDVNLELTIGELRKLVANIFLETNDGVKDLNRVLDSIILS